MSVNSGATPFNQSQKVLISSNVTTTKKCLKKFKMWLFARKTKDFKQNSVLIWNWGDSFNIKRKISTKVSEANPGYMSQVTWPWSYDPDHMFSCDATRSYNDWGERSHNSSSPELPSSKCLSRFLLGGATGPAVAIGSKMGAPNCKQTEMVLAIGWIKINDGSIELTLTLKDGSFMGESRSWQCMKHWVKIEQACRSGNTSPHPINKYTRTADLSNGQFQSQRN